MKIEKQTWVLSEQFLNNEGDLEIEIINKKNQSRIARIIISDFKNLKQALRIAETIASLPELLKKRK